MRDQQMGIGKDADRLWGSPSRPNTYGRGACVRRQSIAIRAIITVTQLSVESFLSAFFFFWIDLHCVRFRWRLACWTRCHRLARGQKP